jgi:DnaJ family protein B protein 13
VIANKLKGFHGGYKYQNNAFQIFERFFGDINPFNNIFDKDGSELHGSLFGSAYGGANQKLPTKPKDVTVTIDCTLKELYNGCLKTFEYEREVLNFHEQFRFLT